MFVWFFLQEKCTIKYTEAAIAVAAPYIIFRDIFFKLLSIMFLL